MLEGSITILRQGYSKIFSFSGYMKERSILSGFRDEIQQTCYSEGQSYFTQFHETKIALIKIVIIDHYGEIPDQVVKHEPAQIIQCRVPVFFWNIPVFHKSTSEDLDQIFLAYKPQTSVSRNIHKPALSTNNSRQHGGLLRLKLSICISLRWRPYKVVRVKDFF